MEGERQSLSIIPEATPGAHLGGRPPAATEGIGYPFCVQQPPFISYGQNREDVVLWRALGSIPNGRYVEVGANDPVQLSVTKAFYDRGWSGLTVEPDPDFAQRLREARPRDEVVEAAVSAHEGDVTFFVFPGTGLSTLDPTVRQKHAAAGRDSREVTVRGARLADLVAESGIAKGDVHFLLVDVEGAEAEVLSTVDFTEWRPWVLLVESTAPCPRRAPTASGRRRSSTPDISCAFSTASRGSTSRTSVQRPFEAICRTRPAPTTTSRTITSRCYANRTPRSAGGGGHEGALA